MTGWLSELHWLVWRLPAWQRLALLPLGWGLLLIIAIWYYKVNS